MMSARVMKHETREAWLLAAVEQIRRIFDAAGIALPKVIHVSCGWPSRGGTKAQNAVLGQCWRAEASGDGAPQIYISPRVEKALEVLGILTHEMIHAALPDAKHGPDFKAAMKQLGLEGKATQAMPNSLLNKDLQVFADRLGEYPHPAINPAQSADDGPKPQKNRQLKIECPRPDLHDGEEYILRGSKRTLELGIPKCPICGNDLVKEEPKEEDAE